MRFALFKEVPKRQRRKKRKLNDGGAARRGSEDGSDEETDGADSGEETEGAERMSMPPAPATRAKAAAPKPPTQDPIWGDESQDVDMIVDQPPQAAEPSTDGTIKQDR